MDKILKASAKKPESKRENKVSQIQKTGQPHSISSPVDQILFLQRTIGNQAVGKLIKSGALRAKLRIGRPGDIYEQEADRVAERVMGMPEPQAVSGNAPRIQRACSACEGDELRLDPIKEEDEKEFKRKEASSQTLQVTPEIEKSINSMRGGGQPLPESVRAFYEPRFGVDFGQVRVHTDAKAAETASAVNARAFTVGKDVVFGAGEYAPEINEGLRLLGHELTHVMQQKSMYLLSTIQREPIGCTGLILDDLKKTIENKADKNSIAELYINLKIIRACFSEFTEKDFLDLVGNKKFSKKELGTIWIESKKPFAGYMASGFDPANRFTTSEKKKLLGYELSTGHKKASDIVNLPTADVLSIYSQADVLFFSGHQYAQYKVPGLWATANNTGFDIRQLNSPMTKVKLIISTSCATICKEAAETFKPLFPNALILGFRKSAPLKGGKLADEFVSKLPKDLILSSDMNGLNAAKSVWKAVAQKAHAGSDSQPGWLNLGSDDMEYWNGKKWIIGKGTDSTNKCAVKGDYSADFPPPSPNPP